MFVSLFIVCFIVRFFVYFVYDIIIVFIHVAMDISADLPELGRTPICVICAGAKSILDLPRTLEVLETQGVPVIGYDTWEFPAFFTRESGLKVSFFNFIHVGVRFLFSNAYFFIRISIY